MYVCVLLLGMHASGVTHANMMVSLALVYKHVPAIVQYNIYKGFCTYYFREHNPKADLFWVPK